MADLKLESQPSRGSEPEGSVHSKQIKNAVGYTEYVAGLDLEFTGSEERRMRWKIDLVIIPIFLITQAFQHMCRTTLNYVNLFGYQEGLELHGNQFSYLSAMVYVGYFFGQYPCGWLIGRFPAQKVLSCGIVGTGLLTIVMTQCRDYSSALAVRFFAGVFMSSIMPGQTLMTGFWFTRREIPLRQCVWFTSVGWGGIMGSYVSMGVSKLPGNMNAERWQLIFYIMGGAACLWAFVVLSFLPDNPSTAKFLSPRERIIAVSRVAANESGIKNKHLDKKQALLAFYDPKAILVSIAIFAGAFPHGVVTSFSTVIIRDMGFTTTTTTALKSVGDAVHIVALFIGGVVILNIRNCKLDQPKLVFDTASLRFMNSSPLDSCDNQHPMCSICSADGISPTIEQVGSSGFFLAGQFPVCKLYSQSHDDLLQHGGLHAQVLCECYDLVSPPMWHLCSACNSQRKFAAQQIVGAASPALSSSSNPKHHTTGAPQ